MGILLAMGILIGFRIKTDAAGVVGALLLLVVMAFAVSWISVLIGVLVSEPDKVQIFGFTTIFPLSFSSSAFVHVHTMPGWMQAWAKINPVSFLADSTRGLINGGPVASPVTKTLHLGRGHRGRLRPPRGPRPAPPRLTPLDDRRPATRDRPCGRAQVVAGVRARALGVHREPSGVRRAEPRVADLLAYGPLDARRVALRLVLDAAYGDGRAEQRGRPLRIARTQRQVGEADEGLRDDRGVVPEQGQPERLGVTDERGRRVALQRVDEPELGVDQGAELRRRRPGRGTRWRLRGGRAPPSGRRRAGRTHRG